MQKGFSMNLKTVTMGNNLDPARSITHMYELQLLHIL